MIELKEGQIVEDIDGNKYEVEAKDCLNESEVLPFAKYLYATKKELKSAIEFLSSLTLKDLRRRQSIAEKEADKGTTNEDYAENEIKQRTIFAAIDIKEFGDNSVNTWVKTIIEERLALMSELNLHESVDTKLDNLTESFDDWKKLDASVDPQIRQRIRDLTSYISEELNYDIVASSVFCLSLIEDVNFKGVGADIAKIFVNKLHKEGII